LPRRTDDSGNLFALPGKGILRGAGGTCPGLPAPGRPRDAVKGEDTTMSEREAVTELASAVRVFFETHGMLFDQAVASIVGRLRAGGKLLIFGNGGSAAQAQHFAAEMTGRFLEDRPAVPAIALAADAPSLTAIGNDMGFERIFARQIEGLGHPGDVAIALTTSGESANVISGLETARDKGLVTVALTGEGGGRIVAESPVDFLLAVPSGSVPRIQEAHLLILHLLAEEIEKTLSS
jgi:D-sedoheptulose 7-phosphate isomerase